MSHIAIVGAGLVGRLLALLLAKNDNPDDAHQISLFEQHSLNAINTTGRVAAAMIAPTAESVTASASIVDMGQQSLLLWPELLRQLGLHTRFQQNGTLVLAHRQDANELRHFQQRLKQRHDKKCQQLSAQQLQNMEPEIPAHFNQSLYLADEGHIDNHQLYDETEQALKQSRVRLYEHTTAEIVSGNLQVNNQLFSCDRIIDCRGLGAQNNFCNPHNQLRGVRGEVIRVRAPEVSIGRPVRLMHPRYAIYIVPKANQHYVIGATEIESSDDKATSVRSTLELLSAAYSVHKGFAEAEIISLQAALRPTLVDNEPQIYHTGRLIQINGLYRHGYLLAPYILQQCLLLLTLLGEQCIGLGSFPAKLNSTLVKQ